MKAAYPITKFACYMLHFQSKELALHVYRDLEKYSIKKNTYIPWWYPVILLYFCLNKSLPSFMEMKHIILDPKFFFLFSNVSNYHHRQNTELKNIKYVCLSPYRKHLLVNILFSFNCCQNLGKLATY